MLLLKTIIQIIIRKLKSDIDGGNESCLFFSIMSFVNSIVTELLNVCDIVMIILLLILYSFARFFHIAELLN